jgi:hypothetical protein
MLLTSFTFLPKGEPREGKEVAEQGVTFLGVLEAAGMYMYQFDTDNNK